MSDKKGNREELFDRDETPEDDADEIFDEEFEFSADDWDDLPEEEASRLLRGLESLIPDIVKRSIVSGLGSTLLSEEGIRSLLADKNIPKDAASFLLSHADTTRREILRIISREIRVFLENMDFGGEIAKILTSISFEIRTEIRFIPNEERVRPNVRNRVKIKRKKGDSGEEVFEEFEQGGEETEESEPRQKTPSHPPETGERSRPREDTEKESKGRLRWTRQKKRTPSSDEE